MTMELSKAKQKADELIAQLKPYCKRIEVAGSIRREVSMVKDIELVAIPDKWKLEKYFLDNNGKEFRLDKNGSKYKRWVHSGLIYVDLFICREDNWGLIYLIRTGSAQYSKQMLAQWKKVSKGGYSKDGYLHTKEGEKIITPEEIDVFNKCKTPFVNPDAR